MTKLQLYTGYEVEKGHPDPKHDDYGFLYMAEEVDAVLAEKDREIERLRRYNSALGPHCPSCTCGSAPRVAVEPSAEQHETGDLVENGRTIGMYTIIPSTPSFVSDGSYPKQDETKYAGHGQQFPGGEQLYRLRQLCTCKPVETNLPHLKGMLATDPACPVHGDN